MTGREFPTPARMLTTDFVFKCLQPWGDECLMSSLTHHFTVSRLSSQVINPDLHLCNHLFESGYTHVFFERSGEVSSANTQDLIKKRKRNTAACRGLRGGDGRRARAGCATYPPGDGGQRPSLMRSSTPDLLRRARSDHASLVKAWRGFPTAMRQTSLSPPPGAESPPRWLLFTTHTRTASKARGIRASAIPVNTST